jgi:serine phosphatase RsbU (regulator of sigma subunit)
LHPFEGQDCVELASVRCRRDVWFDAAQPLAPGDPLACLSPTATGFAHPMLVHDVLVGVLTVGRRSEVPFTAGQASVVRTFGDFLAIQLRNEQSQQFQLQAQLLQREFDLAASIQQSLLPTDHPVLGNWHTVGHCETARRVGGDFYDVMRVGDSGVLLAVADVMGKGLPAALFAAVFRTLLHARPDLATDPGTFLEWLNASLVSELGRLDMFITAQLVFADLKRRELVVGGAGHPPLLIAGRQSPVQCVASSGPPLGVLRACGYTDHRFPVPVGARVLLYTDGLNEARNPAGRVFGLTPLQEWLADAARRGASACVCRDSLTRLLRQFEAAAPANDDQTFALLAEELTADE